jgi:hypothetical protein
MSELQKYKKGERVKVFIGHSMWSNGIEMPNAKLLFEDGKFKMYDIRPQLTEDTATVEYTYGEMAEVDGRFSKGDGGYKRYSLKFDKHGRIAWFDEDNIYLENQNHSTINS